MTNRKKPSRMGPTESLPARRCTDREQWNGALRQPSRCPISRRATSQDCGAHLGGRVIDKATTRHVAVIPLGADHAALLCS